MSVLVGSVARLLLGPSLIVAAAILVKGYAGVGDGFSAGAITGLAIALLYVALGHRQAEALLPVLRRAPQATVAGLLIALACGFFGLAAGDAPFTHAPPAGTEPVVIGTLELITAVAFDVGVFLLVVGVLVTLVHQFAVPADVEADGR